MPAVSVATTSADMGPSTTSQICAMAFLVGTPALARSDGFVVTPSIAPMAAASLISPMSPLSMKNFMVAPAFAGSLGSDGPVTGGTLAASKRQPGRQFSAGRYASPPLAQGPQAIAGTLV